MGPHFYSRRPTFGCFLGLALSLLAACQSDDELSPANTCATYAGRYSGICLTPNYPDFTQVDTSDVVFEVSLGENDSTLVLTDSAGGNTTAFICTAQGMQPVEASTPYTRSLRFHNDTLFTRRRPSLGAGVTECVAVRK